MNGASVLLKWMLRAEQFITAAAFLLMVGVLGLDIFGREVLGSGKIWATPIAVFCNVAVAFIGIGIASAHGAHLRPKFLDKLAPRRLDGGFDRLTDAGFALFCLGAGWLCWRVVQETIELQETDPVLQWPLWPFQLFLVLGFGLAVVRHALYAAWPGLRPQAEGGENAPPTEEQVQLYAQPASETTASSPKTGAPP